MVSATLRSTPNRSRISPVVRHSGCSWSSATMRRRIAPRDPATEASGGRWGGRGGRGAGLAGLRTLGGLLGAGRGWRAGHVEEALILLVGIAQHGGQFRDMLVGGLAF